MARAAAQRERHFGGRAYLDLPVRVRRHWRADDALLDRLGSSGAGGPVARGLVVVSALVNSGL